MNTVDNLTEVERLVLLALVDNFEPCSHDCPVGGSAWPQAARRLLARVGPELQARALEDWAAELRGARRQRPLEVTPDLLDRRARELRRPGGEA